MNDHQCSGKCRREGCPNCPHGKGDEEHCDVCDKVTKAPEIMNYEHHSHLHCWENLAHPCNIKLEDHKQCCLCDLKESDEKPRWSQCNDCFDDDHNKCSGGSCACSLVHPEHHPMQHESKPQDWQDGLKEALAAPNDAKHWYDYQCRVFDEIRSLLDSRYQEGVKAERARIIERIKSKKIHDIDDTAFTPVAMHGYNQALCEVESLLQDNEPPTAAPKNIDSSTNSVV